MIRKNIAALVFFCAMLCMVCAQDVPKINVPASPAFSILGFEPSAVMRPANAKSLATDVLNSFDENGKILMNLGLEVSPYWLKSHPGLTRKKYLYPNFGQTFKQTFSLSAGTAKDSATGNNKLGAGFRFRLSNGKPTDALITADAELIAKADILNAINGVRATLEDADTKPVLIDAIVKNLQDSKTDEIVIASVKRQAEKLAKDFGDTPVELKKFLEKLIADRDASEIELKKKVSDMIYDRKGLIVEFAGATGYNQEKNGFERIGFWGNISSFVSPDDLFTLTARYLHQSNDTSITNVDIGLGFLKKSTTYNISVEGMLRWFRAEIPDVNMNNQPITRLDKDFTYRFTIQGSYIISKDISVNLSIGKDFESPFISGKSVFSILGLNYSLFSKEPQQLN